MDDHCFFRCGSLLAVTCEWGNLDNVDAAANAFDEIFPEARLYVPKGTVEIYKAKEPWSNFKYIEETDNSGETGIANVTDQRGVPVSRSGRYITVSGLDDGEAASLYTTSGQLLSTSRAVAAGTVTLDTMNESGVLILKTATGSMKIKN